MFVTISSGAPRWTNATFMYRLPKSIPRIALASTTLGTVKQQHNPNVATASRTAFMNRPVLLALLVVGGPLVTVTFVVIILSNDVMSVSDTTIVSGASLKATQSARVCSILLGCCIVWME